MRLLLVFLIVLIAGLSSPSALGQGLTGRVLDSASRRPVSFGDVRLFPGPGATSTAVDGSFTLPVNPAKGTHVISSAMGYRTDTISLLPGQRDVIILLSAWAGTLPEVEVRSGRERRVDDTNPVPVTVVSSRELEHALAGNIIDNLVSRVPGLQAVKTGPNISKPFIRGLGYNRVLTLFDGLRQEGQQWGDEHGIEVDSYHLESAEVTRGPASLKYGSDALAGVVSLVPALQRERDGRVRGRFLTEYQSNHGMMGSGIRLGAGRGHWLLNVQGSYRRAANYSNRVDGRVYNTGFQESNAAFSVGNFSKRGNSLLNLTLFDDAQGIPDGSRDSLSRKFTKQIDEFPADQIKNRPIVSDGELRSYALSPLHQRIQHYRIYSRHHYFLGKGDIDVLLGYQENYRKEYNHPTQPRQPGLNVRLRTLNLSTQYSFPVFHTVGATVGFNGMAQFNRHGNATDFPIPDFQLYEMGVFGILQWKFKQLSVSAGYRQDNRHLKGPDFYVRPRSGTGWMVHTQDPVGAELQFPALAKQYSGSSWSLGLTYRLTEKISVKANGAKGYRAPNITEVASAGLDPGAHILYLGNRNFVPEYNVQEDVELHGDFEWIRASVSLFNNQVHHFIYLARSVNSLGVPIVLEGGNKVYEYQQAKAQLYGLESSLEIYPFGKGSLRVSHDFSLVYGFNRGAAFRDRGVEGEFLPLIPPRRGLTQWVMPIKLNGKSSFSTSVRVEMEAFGTQNRYLALDESESRTPGYTLWNAGVEFEMVGGRKKGIHCQFQINNLFDRSYQSGLSRLKYFEYYKQSPNGHLGIDGMGRNVCFKIIVPI